MRRTVVAVTLGNQFAGLTTKAITTNAKRHVLESQTQLRVLVKNAAIAPRLFCQSAVLTASLTSISVSPDATE